MEILYWGKLMVFALFAIVLLAIGIGKLCAWASGPQPNDEPDLYCERNPRALGK